MDLRGFDSSRILMLRGGILMSIGNFLESLSQAILVGIILAGRLGVGWLSRPFRPFSVCPLAVLALRLLLVSFPLSPSPFQPEHCFDNHVFRLVGRAIAHIAGETLFLTWLQKGVRKLCGAYCYFYLQRFTLARQKIAQLRAKRRSFWR